MYLIGLLVLVSSCQKKSSQNLLLYVNDMNKLEFLVVNDKCGEWGGDEKTLTIYRDDFKGQLYADYVEKVKTCGTGDESKVSKSIKHVKLSQHDNELIIECINELCSNKLSRENYPSHSGIFNQIKLSDSSMIIHDFPSIELIKFNELAERIKKK